MNMNKRSDVYFLSLVIISYHEYAQLHIAKMTLQKTNELGYETLPHPPYSPDHFSKHLNTLCPLKF